MPTKLDQLVNAIHPDQTRNVVQQHVDEVLNGFPIISNIIIDAIEYRDIVCRFVERLDRRFGLLPEGMLIPKGVLWERAVRLLRETYGPHGEVAAYEMQRAGAETGLTGVLRRMANQAAEERVKADVAAWVTAFCEHLSAEEYLAAGEEYVCKHARVLPAEMRGDPGYRARLNLAELLKRHHQLLVSTNRVGR